MIWRSESRAYADAMSPAAAQRKRPRARGKRAGKKRTRPAWLVWLPLFLALVATPFAVRAASVLALSGPGALRLLFPAVALVQAHAPAPLVPEQRETLAAWAMWAQFPVYGLLASVVTWRRSLLAGLFAALATHLAALAALAVTGRS